MKKLLALTLVCLALPAHARLDLSALLEASRLDAGKYRAEIGVASIADIVEPLKHQFGVQAGARGIRLHFVESAAWVRTRVRSPENTWRSTCVPPA